MLFEFETNFYDDKRDIVLNPEEGFLKGNLFEDLYVPYKNYQPADVKATTECEAYLIKIMMLCFAINELNLYLDINPDDQNKYELFKKYCLMYKKCVEEYEKKYQVLELTDDIFGKYTFNSNPWPWEVN